MKKFVKNKFFGYCKLEGKHFIMKEKKIVTRPVAYINFLLFSGIGVSKNHESRGTKILDLKLLSQ